MLSFFSKKKHTDTPPEDVIQGPEAAVSGDDFIFVEKKNGDPSQPAGAAANAMYPPMPTAFGGLPYPVAYRPDSGGRAVGTNSSLNTPVPYVQDVPFELSPQLCTKSAYELTQMQVDGILALMTRQMSVEDDYNFSLERSIQNDCY